MALAAQRKLSRAAGVRILSEPMYPSVHHRLPECLLLTPFSVTSATFRCLPSVESVHAILQMHSRF